MNPTNQHLMCPKCGACPTCGQTPFPSPVEPLWPKVTWDTKTSTWEPYAGPEGPTANDLGDEVNACPKPA